MVSIRCNGYFVGNGEPLECPDEEYKSVSSMRSLREVETILNFVYGAFRSYMSFNANTIFHDFGQAE